MAIESQVCFLCMTFLLVLSNHKGILQPGMLGGQAIALDLMCTFIIEFRCGGAAFAILLLLLVAAITITGE